jgi:hypothetical protein
VTTQAQKGYQRSGDAFGREPAHALAVNDVFVRKIICDKRLCGPNIVVRQLARSPHERGDMLEFIFKRLSVNSTK